MIAQSQTPTSHAQHAKGPLLTEVIAAIQAKLKTSLVNKDALCALMEEGHCQEGARCPW